MSVPVICFPGGMVVTLKDTGLAAAKTLTVELRLGKEKGE